MAEGNEFLAGVIEGFYGQPWSQAERFQLFDWLKQWGLNTYFYAPKDDLKHRALWRELYSDEEALELKTLISACAAQGLHFIYGIAPGLDIKYSNDWEMTVLKVKLEQLQKLGCRNFAILFDDIPERMREEDAKKFSNFAKAQCHIANTAYGLVKVDRFFFCPTAYCSRMVSAKLGGEDYLATIGKGLSPRIDVFWTGPEIISREITAEHAREIAAILKRKPVIWDNLHANDYDPRRFYCGPYSGRPFDLRGEVAGILTNPNCEFPLNYIPLRTFGNYVLQQTAAPRIQYLEAMKEWHQSFRLARGKVSLEDLILFGDCFYLPHEDGEEADWTFVKIKHALSHPGEKVRETANLRDFCSRLAELKNRDLFYALSKRAWELREEMDLLTKFLAGQDKSDFHLPKTYCGGFVARLQKLLKQKPDGSFAP